MDAIKTNKENIVMETSANRLEERASIVKVLLACGVIGPVLFIILFLIEGATRADYSPLRQPVSSLSIGGKFTQYLTGLPCLVFSFLHDWALSKCWVLKSLRASTSVWRL
jgi:hypothetical protein